MKMDKKTIIAIVLIVFALGVVVYQTRSMFVPTGPKTPPVTATSAQKKPFAPATAAPTQLAAGGPSAGNSVQSLMASGYATYIAKLAETDIEFSGKRFKNPMTPIVGGDENAEPQVWVPVVNTSTSIPGIEELSTDDTLEGIVWNDKDPLALVNDQIVGVGEELEDGAVVTAITQDTVKFSRNGNRYYLVLREE